MSSDPIGTAIRQYKVHMKSKNWKSYYFFPDYVSEKFHRNRIG